jgi:YesN/AraC family two-component response regulator
MAFRRDRRKSRSVYVTWLVSYISVLLVPVLISGIIYAATLHVVKTEINRANESVLVQMEQAIDSQIQGIESLSLEVALNRNISSFVTADAELSDADHYELYRIADDLRVYEIANDFIHNIYVYYKNSRTAISKNERLHADGLKQSLRFGDSTSFEAFFDRRYIKEYRPVLVQDGIEWTPSVMFAQSVALSSRELPGAVLLFMIDRNKLLEQAPVPENGSITIVDRNDQTVATTAAPDAPLTLRYEQMPGDKGQAEHRSGGGATVASYTTSPVTGWKYVMTVPADVYHQKMNVVKQLTVASVLLCLAVGGVVTYAFLRRNYSPIHALIQSLSYKAGVRFDEGSNEFHFLEQALDNTFHEKGALHRKLHQHHNTIRSYFLQRLLKGQVENGIPIHEAFSAHDVRFDAPYFSVLLLRIEHFGKFDAEADQRVRSSRLLHFLIANVAEELSRASNQAYAVELDNEMLACIVNLGDPDPARHRQELERIAAETKDFIFQHTQVHLTVASSGAHEGEYGIPQAFQEALEAMEYRIVVGSGGVIHYDDLRPADDASVSSGYFYPLLAEQQLIAFLREGNREKADAALEEIVRKNVNAEPFSFHIAKCVMYDLLGTILKALNEVRAANRPEPTDGARFAERFLSCHTIREMRDLLSEAIRYLCDYVNEHREYHANPLIDDVMAYVNERFRDENLNISMIGDAFGLTPSYVSKLFKEHTGESLLDYINKKRLAEAKALLTRQKHTVGEVAVLVGYGDVNTFYRIFKKFEGVTPGRYKEIQ